MDRFEEPRTGARPQPARATHRARRSSRATAAWVLSLLMLAGATPALAIEPDDPSYRAGLALLNKGMHDLAAPELEAFLKTNPSGPRATTARYALAVCYAKLGRMKDAAAPLDEVLKDASFELMPDAILLRAQCAGDAGEWAKAAAFLDGLGKKHQDFPQLDRAAALQGECLWRAGELAKAEAVLSAALRQWPQSAAVDAMRYALAGVEEGLGRDEKALERASEVATGAVPEYASLRPQAALIAARCAQRLGRAAQAGEMYALAGTSSDAALQAASALGQAQLARLAGDPKSALARLDAFDAIAPAPGTEALTRAARLERAASLLDAKQFESALDASRAAGEGADAGQRLEAGIIGARALMALERWDDASAALGGVVEGFGEATPGALRPRVLDAMRLRASSLASAGKHEDSSSAWKLVRERSGEKGEAGVLGEALAGEAIAEHASGNWERCLAAGRAYLAAHADGPAAADVTLAVAESAYALQKWGEAAGAYASLVGRWPEHPQAWRARVREGLAHWEGGKRTDATRLLALAVSEAEGAERDPALVRASCLVLGQAAFASSDFPAAERWFERAVAAGGQGDHDLRLRLGLAIARQGEWERALAHFAEAAKHSGEPDATSLHAVFEQGQALMELARYDEAKPLLERVVASKGALGETGARFMGPARRHLATIASKAGRREEAIELLALASESGGDGAASAALARADLLLASAKYEDAKAGYERFTEEHPRDARVASARAGRAIAMSRQDASEGSLKAVEAALAESADASRAGVPARELADSLRYEHAWLLAKLGKVAAAREAYRELADSGAALALRRQASAEWAQLEFDAGDAAGALAALGEGEGVSAARAALWTDEPGRVASDEVGRHAAYLRGAALLKLDRAKEAAEALAGLCDPEVERSGAPDARALSAGLLRGDALLRAGAPAKAAAQLAWVETGKPEAAIASATLLRLAEATAAAQDWPASQGACERFLASHGASDQAFRARFAHGWALENQGQHQEAIGSYRSVTASHQGATAARAQFQIGECLYAMKSYEDAVKEFVKVDAIYASEEWAAAALFEAGRCLEDMKRRGDARARWQEVVDRFGKSAWARQAKERLEATAPAALPGR